MSMEVVGKDGSKWVLSSGNALFKARSRIPLTQGQILGATVHIESGKVFLQLQDTSVQTQLQNRGIAFTPLVQDMVRFFQQNMMKVDVSLMEKARGIASRFPGKEKKAMEAVLMLASEGIELDENTVGMLLSLVDSWENGSLDGQSQGGEESSDVKCGPEGGNSLISFLESLGVSSAGRKQGFLSLFNHLRAQKYKTVMVPVESENGGHGMICFVLDPSEKRTDRICIRFFESSTNWNVVLYFRNRSVNRLCFFCNSMDSRNVAEIRKDLSVKFGISADAVEFGPEFKLDFLNSTGEDIRTFSGMA